MSTYFKDFRAATQGDLERAWEFAGTRSSLGHNVRFIVGGEDRTYRVFFSAGVVDVSNATNVKDVPKEAK